MEPEGAVTSSVLAVLGHVDRRSAILLFNSVLQSPCISECFVALIGAAASGAGSSSSGDATAVTAGAINTLACLLDAVALSARPRLRCVPLLPAAGWTVDRIAMLDSPQLLLVLQSPPQPPASARLAPQPQPPSSRQVPPQGPHAQHQQHLQTEARTRGRGEPQQRGELRPAGSPLGGEADVIRPAPGLAAVQPLPEYGTEYSSGGAGGERGTQYDIGGAELVADELDRLRPGHLARWVRRKVGAHPEEDLAAAAAAASNNATGGVRQTRQGFQQGPQGHGDGSGGGYAVQSHGGGGASDSMTRPAAVISAPADSAAGTSGAVAAAAAAAVGNPAPYVTLVDGAPADPTTRLRFHRVAVGGTFDRLHAGHELLLAATALVADGFVFVGVTADELLANKSHRELLQPYGKRAEEAVSYIRAVRPDLKVEAGALRDPKTPTLAELDPSMEALVVSVETLQGAAAINAGRAARGFPALTIVTVPVIGVGQPQSAGAAATPSGAGAGARAGTGRGGESSRSQTAAAGLATNKLSSSGLRAMEAAEAAAAAATGKSSV